LQLIQGFNGQIYDSAFIFTSHLFAGSRQTWDKGDIESSEYDIDFGIKSILAGIKTEREIDSTELWNNVKVNKNLGCQII